MPTDIRTAPLDGKWDTVTRTELLEQRGYPADVIAGNGRTQTHDSASGVEAEPSPPAATPEPVNPQPPTPAQRKCRMCGKKLGARQEKWCSALCRGRAKRDADRTPKPASPIVSPGTEARLDLPSLTGAVQALTRSGWTLESAILESGGIRLAVAAHP
jgi:hypothetical protein